MENNDEFLKYLGLWNNNNDFFLSSDEDSDDDDDDERHYDHKIVSCGCKMFEIYYLVDELQRQRQIATVPQYVNSPFSLQHLALTEFVNKPRVYDKETFHFLQQYNRPEINFFVRYGKIIRREINAFDLLFRKNCFENLKPFCPCVIIQHLPCKDTSITIKLWSTDFAECNGHINNCPYVNGIPAESEKEIRSKMNNLVIRRPN